MRLETRAVCLRRYGDRVANHQKMKAMEFKIELSLSRTRTALHSTHSALHYPHLARDVQLHLLPLKCWC